MNFQSCCSALVCPALQVHSRAGAQPSVRWPAWEPIRACPYVCWRTPAAPEASAVLIESSERRVSFRPPSVTAQAMAARSYSRAWPQPRRAGGGEEFHCIAQLRPLPSCRIRPQLAAHQGSLLDSTPAVQPAASGSGHCFRRTASLRASNAGKPSPPPSRSFDEIL